MFGLCWHKWGKWSEFKDGTLQVDDGRKVAMTYQERTCAKCGKKQITKP